jgi:PAS domain S-box-containing protein
LPELFISEDELRAIWSNPNTRRKLLEELKHTGFVKNREISLQKSDGSVISVLVTALAKIDQNGEIEQISGLVEDITGRRATEDELQVIKKEILDVIEFLPDPTFIIDNEKKVVVWNSAMEVLTGVSRADILGIGGYAHAFPFYGEARPILIDLIDETDQKIAEWYGRVKRDGTSLETEILVPSLHQGKGAVLRAKAAPLSNPQGNRIGAIETIHDISDTHPLVSGSGTEDMSADAPRGQSEPATPRAISPASPAHIPSMISLLYLSNALKRANDGITLIDTSARCVWVNDALVRMLGVMNSDAIAGKSVVDFISSDQRKAVLDHLTALLHSGPVSLPLSVITTSGNIPVDTSISGISDENGELLGYMLIMRNNKQ